ncbi:TPA: hypothetical protein ACV5EP_002339 [Enterococcus faecium]|nr:hypothetical protein [Enterococcus faecium]HBM7181221.1 hypothetical protein [Enterococcus faecium]HBM7204729.1 hypothetical protein [Enterococcus faecium]
MKKNSRIVMMGVALVSGLVLAGCGNGSASNSDKVELSINYYNGAISKKNHG